MEDNNLKNDFHGYNPAIYAGFWIRFCAYITDLLIIGSIARIIRGPLLIVFGSDRISAGYFQLTLASVIFSLYFVLFTKFTNGQTVGKIIFALKVVCFREEKLSWQTVIVREFFGRYVNKVLLFLYIITAFTPRKQHAIDYLCDTSVISLSCLETWESGKNTVLNRVS